MSIISDPLIKDIKECVRQLHRDQRKITDCDKNVECFCIVVEKIFYKGLVRRQSFFYGDKKHQAYSWMTNLPLQGSDLHTFNYNNSIEEVQSCKTVKTLLGKFRLLVRHCLMKKCLHLPVETLLRTKKYGALYEKNSILGDEILGSILLSVLLHANKINYDLDLCNSYFLDRTWQLPHLVRLELVPCKSLGIGVSFSEDKAFIVDVTPDGVAAESGAISNGDVLANLNGVAITSSCKGRLNAILNLSKGKPVNLAIIKAFHKQSGEVFIPIKSILRNLQIDIVTIKSDDSLAPNDATNDKVSLQNTKKTGYAGTYLDCVDVRDKGGVKEIEETIKAFSRKVNFKKKSSILFRIEEMGIEIINVETNQIILKHAFMQISSCGSIPNFPNYIAYIAGNSSVDSKCARFVCHVFYVNNIKDANTILQSIGQGFYRTHFAV